MWGWQRVMRHTSQEKMGSFGRSKGDERENYHPLNSVLGVTAELDGICFTRRMREVLGAEG